MAKVGRKKLPTRTLELRGSWRAKTRPNEPKPEPGRPICPKWLSQGAKAVWKRLVPQLDAMRILTKVDGAVLVRYVEMYALWLDTMRDLDAHGPRWPQKDAQGNVVGYVDRPEVGRMLRLNEALGRIEAKFGLSPSDRASLTVIPQGGGPGEGQQGERTADFLNLRTG